jgi:hypothetical protein
MPALRRVCWLSTVPASRPISVELYSTAIRSGDPSHPPSAFGSALLASRARTLPRSAQSCQPKPTRPSSSAVATSVLCPTLEPGYFATVSMLRPPHANRALMRKAGATRISKEGSQLFISRVGIARLPINEHERVDGVTSHGMHTSSQW